MHVSFHRIKDSYLSLQHTSAFQRRLCTVVSCSPLWHLSACTGRRAPCGHV